MKILILRIILRKMHNSKKNSKNKKILRIRMLVNTAPGDFIESNFCQSLCVVGVANCDQ